MESEQSASEVEPVAEGELPEEETSDSWWVRWLHDEQFWKDITKTAISGTIMILVAATIASIAGFIDAVDFVRVVVGFIGIACGVAAFGCFYAVTRKPTVARRVALIVTAVTLGGIGLYLAPNALMRPDFDLVVDIRNFLENSDFMAPTRRLFRGQDSE